MLAISSSIVTLALAASSVLGATTHTVLVGQNSTKTFTPSELTADVGDTVTFSFVGGNHTASQSTFAAPCTNAGFKSGFVPGSGDVSNATTFSILVNETTPIWVYCGQTGHCAAGMVMSINAATTGNKTFSAFQALAMGTSAATNTTGAGDSTATGTSTKGSKDKSTATGTDATASSTSTEKTKSSKNSTSSATDSAAAASGTAANDTTGTSAASLVVASSLMGIVVTAFGAVIALL